MAAMFADPLGGNVAPYANWANAATNPQTIIDLQIVGGGGCHYRGAFVLAASLDFDTNAGTAAGGYIEHIGYNAAGVNDGTRAVFNGNGAAVHCIAALAGNKHYHWFENIECLNATDSGIRLVLSRYHVFVNVISHDNGDKGIEGDGAGCVFYRCLFYNNTNEGMYRMGTEVRIILCGIYGNGFHGLEAFQMIRLYVDKTIIHDNGDNDTNIRLPGGDSIIAQSVLDGTDQAAPIAIQLGTIRTIMFANRITHHTTGIDAVNLLGLYGWNFFHGNTNDLINNAVIYPVPLDANNNTNQLAQAQDNYNGLATDDFNLQAGGAGTYTGDGDDVVDMNVGA